MPSSRTRRRLSPHLNTTSRPCATSASPHVAGVAPAVARHATPCPPVSSASPPPAGANLVAATRRGRVTRVEPSHLKATAYVSRQFLEADILKCLSPNINFSKWSYANAFLNKKYLYTLMPVINRGRRILCPTLRTNLKCPAKRFLVVRAHAPPAACVRERERKRKRGVGEETQEFRYLYSFGYQDFWAKVGWVGFRKRVC